MDLFRPLDFLALDDQFSEDERMVRDTVRSWVSERWMPLVMEHWEAGTFPTELTPELAELGVFGPTLPEQYGCAGLNSVAYGLICQELERGDSGLRSFVSVQGSLVMYPIYAYGTEEQKKKYLPKLASGELIGCFGLTEPDAGSNPGGMTTVAAKDGNGWVLNGPQDVDHERHDLRHRHRVGQGRGRHPRLRRAERREGLQRPEQKHKWSLRASITSELVLEDVRVSADALAAERQGPRGSARLPHAGALRHRLGRRGRGHGRASTRRCATRRSASCSTSRWRASRSRRRSSPTSPPTSRWRSSRAARRAHEGPGPHEALARVDGQAQQRRHGAQRRRAPCATCSAPTGSRSSTTRAVTCAIWSRCTPTRARTTSTRSRSAGLDRLGPAYR
jgi:hypothetical protein